MLIFYVPKRHKTISLIEIFYFQTFHLAMQNWAFNSLIRVGCDSFKSGTKLTDSILSSEITIKFGACKFKVFNFAPGPRIL